MNFPPMEKILLLTNDVETTSIVNGGLRDSTGNLVLTQGMPRLLDLYDKYEIKTTFFYTGYIAKLYPDVVRMAKIRGHEIACHGLTHDNKYAFDVLTLKEQINHLREAKDILENISGQEVITFRAPALRINRLTATALAETGFEYDSSLAAKRFDFFMSHGTSEKLNWLFANRKPYRTDPDNLFKKGNGKIIEVPLSALIVPYIGTVIRIFPNLSKFLRNLLIFDSSITGTQINLLVHPNEVIDEGMDMSSSIPDRSNNYMEYIFADKVRHYLKLKNLGINALRLFEREIVAFEKSDFKFYSVRDYIEKNFKLDKVEL